MSPPAAPTRRRTLLSAALSLCLAGACGSEPERTPNVLLISVDSLRRDHVSAYGHANPFNRAEPTTPTFERLAREGALFEHAVSTTSWTLPSHMALMTGLPDLLHGVTDNHRQLSPALSTLAELLRAHGFATGGFFSGPNLHPVYGFDRGFDVYSNLSHVEPEQQVFADPTPGALKDMHRESHQAVTSPEVLAASTSWIRARVAEGRPFFAFVHWWDPHYDYLAPAEYVGMYPSGYAGRIHGIHRREYQIEDWTRPELAHLRALYDAEIRYTDDHLGRLLALLDELGVARDTIVVLLADHGEEFYEYGRWGHQRTLDDVVVRIPLLWRWPGHIPAGARPQGQARIQDVFATLCELLALAPPPWLESRSLVPLWEDPERAGHAQYLHLDVPLREILLEGVMEPDKKILWQRGEGQGWIYDLRPATGQKLVDRFYNLKSGEHAGAVAARAAIAELRAAKERLPAGAESVPLDPATMDPSLLNELEGLGYIERGGEQE